MSTTLTHTDLLQRIDLLPTEQRQQALRRFHQTYPTYQPPVTRSAADQRLYDACRWDLAAFAQTFFPHLCTEAFNAVHTDYYTLYAQRQGSRGHRDAVAAPRGASKTTGCAIIGILHDCVYEIESFVVYLTNIYTNSANKVKQIRDELEHNAVLVRVFGPQVGDVWNQADFTTVHGVRVLAAARNTQVRGITARGQRPSKLVIDDVEHPEHVVTEEQRLKTELWFSQDILRLGKPRTNVEVSGTILHPQSLLRALLDNPGWQSRFYQSVLEFADPAALPLWQEWRTIFVNLENPQRQTDARAFYEVNEQAMTAKARVLWPERFDYYALMVIRLVDGETAFFQELQNDPQGDTRYIFNMDAAAYCTLMPEGIIRAGGHYIPFLDIPDVVSYLDPTPEKRDVKGTDYASCPVIMRDKDGYCYVVDTYLEQVASTARQIDSIVDMLWRWKVNRMGVEVNSFQSLILQDIREAVAVRAKEEGTSWNVQFVRIMNMRNKILRIKTLEPMVENGWLQFAKGLPGEAIRQFAEFLPIENASHDDFPDSCEGGVRVIKGLYDKRAAW